MLHDPNPKFKRLITGRCQHCGAGFFTAKRTGRPPLFCSKKCRQAEFRFLSGLRRSGFEPEGTVSLIRDETPQKSEVGSRPSNVDFGDRPPVEILGHGRRWNGGKSIDRQLVVVIIETEIGGAPGQPDSNRPPNPHLAEIPDDLSVPAFLRRASAASRAP